MTHKDTRRIDARSPQVHYLFEGLLSGQIERLTPDQREILVLAMGRAFPALKRREKVAKRVQQTGADRQKPPKSQAKPPSAGGGAPRWAVLVERLAWGAVVALSLWLAWIFL